MTAGKIVVPRGDGDDGKKNLLGEYRGGGQCLGFQPNFTLLFTEWRKGGDRQTDK